LDCEGFFFSPGSEVLIDEKRICVKEAKIAEVKDYRSYIYADIGFSKMNIYPPSLWYILSFLQNPRTTERSGFLSFFKAGFPPAFVEISGKF